MAHSANIISSIKLPNGTTYEIHDAQAIHSIEELGLSAALVFKGTLANTDELYALTGFKAGHVYLIGDTEYVAVKDYAAGSSDAQESFWEELGNVHDAASTTHTHNVTVTGTNAASAVTGTVTVPTVSKTTKYLTASVTAGSVNKTTDTVLGTSTKFTATPNLTTVGLRAEAEGVAVGANGTAKAITALNTATIKNPSVSGVTASKVSTASLLASATVTNGVLSFGTASVTDVSASKVSTSDVTVATSAKSTADALTGVTVTSQPIVTIVPDNNANDVEVVQNVSVSVSASGDNVTALTGVTVGAPTVTLSDTATSGIEINRVTVGSTSASLANGSAAAQKWTQSTGTTGTPIG